MIKAIIFDFGNVICSFDNSLFISKISKHTNKSIKELNNLIYHKSNLPNLYETGEISSNEFFERITKLCELKISKDIFIEAYTNIFSPIKSTFKLIKDLKDNYKLALLSNVSEWDFNLGIKSFGIFNLFEAVSLSFKIKAMKPNKEIFLDCIKKLHLKPEECIYIDDIKEYSNKATELGMGGIHYTSEKELLKSLKSFGVEI